MDRRFRPTRVVVINQAAALIRGLTLSRRIAELLLALLVLAGCSRPIDSSADLNADPAADALPIPTGPLQLLELIEVDARIRELRFYSPALAAETRVRVLLPVSYDASRATTYPVTYLLHGCCSNGGGDRSWTEDLGLAELAQSLDQAFVMPEGGNGGLYSDWYNAGAGGPPRWESYHIRELLPWMEARYRLRRDRRGRSLLGISMGGHGAFAYAAKYPQYFGNAAALSPALDSNTLLGRTVLDDGAVLDGGVEDDIWGSRAS